MIVCCEKVAFAPLNVMDWDPSPFVSRFPSTEVVKLCQIVGVFPGARMNDGTEAGRIDGLVDHVC